MSKEINCVCDLKKGIYLHYRDQKGKVRCDGAKNKTTFWAEGITHLSVEIV